MRYLPQLAGNVESKRAKQRQILPPKTIKDSDGDLKSIRRTTEVNAQYLDRTRCLLDHCNHLFADVDLRRVP